mgnify:FL=1
MTNALQNLPPEMQARLAQIMAGAQTPQQQQPAAPAPQVQQPVYAPQPAEPAAPPKPPSLIDHVLNMRAEQAVMKEAVMALNNQMIANSQVLEAIGQAVGRMYQMFQPSEHAMQDPTYSQNFQNSQLNEQDGDY